MGESSPAQQAAALRERGSTLLDLGRPQEAMTALAGAMRLDPDVAATFALLGLALRRLGRHDDSLRVLENGLQRSPNDEWLHRLASQAHATRGDLERALASAEEAQRLGPEVWQAKHQVVDVLIDLGRLDDARRVAEALVALAPEEASSHNQLGRIALVQDRLIEAEHAFRHALALAPGEAVFHDNVGIALYHQGRVAAATRFFDSALSADPTRTTSQHNLYGSSKTLKQHSLLPSPKRLLESVSPKAYRYFLHREGETFRMLAINYLVKLVVPLALVAAAGVWAYSAATARDVAGTVALWFCGLATVGVFAVGWLLRIPVLQRWLTPRASEVAFYSNVLPIVFNPLWLVLAGGVWIWRQPDDWILGLVALLAGAVLSGRVVARRIRGAWFAFASRTWPWRRRQRARLDAAIDRSPVGRPLRGLVRAARIPYVWLPVAFVFAMSIHDTPFEALGGLAMLVALFASLIGLLGDFRRLRAWLGQRFAPRG